jgi:hypothetical protein
MPRKKKIKDPPISTSIFNLNGQTYEAEEWETYPDKGTRGSHRRKLKSDAFDTVLKRISDQYYFSNSPREREITKRRLYDKRFHSELVSEIKKICVANRIAVGRSTIYEITKDLRTAIHALDNAIAASKAGNPETHSATPKITMISRSRKKFSKNSL